MGACFNSFFNSLITPEGVSGILTMIGTITAATIATLTIRRYKEHKAYELFTAKRLRTYDYILKAHQELMTVSSVDYINMAAEQSREKYLADLEAVVSKFNGLLSTTEKEECFLLKEHDLLHEAVKGYLESKSTETEQILTERRDRIKYFTDIYLWALWRYIQRLHKKKDEEKYPTLYEEQFEKVFEKSRKLNERKTMLFEDKEVEKFVYYCPYRRKCGKYRRCKKKTMIE